MYHAVMEEVARFLERCYQSFESIQQKNQMERANSAIHVFNPDEKNDGASTIRARSCTSTMEKPKRIDIGRKFNETSSTIESYKQFSEFTR